MSDGCNWTDDDEGTWTTECGNAFVLIDGGPAENSIRYCCYCGKPIVVQKYFEPVDDEED